MNIKRTILWVVLAVSLLMLHDNWQRSNGLPPLFFQGSATQTVPNTAPNLSTLPAPVASAQNHAAPAGTAALQGDRITIVTDTVRAQIDTLGGSLVRLELLHQLDKQGQPVVLFQRNSAQTYLARSGLVDTAELPNHNTLFQVQPGTRELIPGSDSLEFHLEAEKNNLKLIKTYVFKRGSYLIDTRFQVLNQGKQTVTPTLYLELVRDSSKIDESSFYSTFTGPVTYTDKEKFGKIEFKDIDKGKAHYPHEIAPGEPGWVGMAQHYFASAWLTDPQQKRNIYVEKIADNLYRAGIKQTFGEIAPGNSKTLDARLFVGPQEEHLLEATAPGLELVKDYGWLTVIAKPLFWLLAKLQAILGNWGWAIVALTVLIKLVFFPLSAASYRSMARMKEMQPRIVALRERHKGDSQKTNQAMMELYRAEKINPVGGCFPVLIQIPVFIALYWVLLASVEMRNAPWIGWIHDLSSPDPYYVLPVLMAVSMFIQTKLNPTPPDPIQAKIMLFMPLVFSVMFFFFPAGLVLYWVVNNILSIAQQWQISRMSGQPKNKIIPQKK
ncbi:MAG: membrane protein insertase YidC [Ottowia sp.]|nr:membrane protein insertase YidC [Ottowia sp.]